MITEVARGVLAEMETSFEALRTDVELVATYQRRVFERQIAIERSHVDGFVSDRAFDNLAYAAGHTTVLAELLGAATFAEYMEGVPRGVGFFLPPPPSPL